jgi:hypothetical protein
VGGHHHAPAALLPGKTRYPLYRRLGGPQARSGCVRKISPPPGFDPRTVQSVAQSLYRLIAQSLYRLSCRVHTCPEAQISYFDCLLLIYLFIYFLFIFCPHSGQLSRFGNKTRSRGSIHCNLNRFVSSTKRPDQFCNPTTKLCNGLG